jgi:putative tryptophan/tyrosine transport system substrate-binding protein
MRRRDFIRAIACSTTAWPFAAGAQQSSRSRLIGVLINAPENDPEMQASLIALKQELERLNWSDGRNARFDIRFTQGNLDQMRGLTKEMVAMQPDVIFVHTTPLVAVAQKETSTIPIVFVNASDPVGSGFVASLARPGGNLTGLLLYEESIVGKWLWMLKEIAPQMKRVAFIANPKFSAYYYFLTTAQQISGGGEHEWYRISAYDALAAAGVEVVVVEQSNMAHRFPQTDSGGGSGEEVTHCLWLPETRRSGWSY